YTRPPPSSLHASGTYRCAVSPGSCQYPRPTPAPPSTISPSTPSGTGCPQASSSRTCVFQIAAPSGTRPCPGASLPSQFVETIVASVVPYWCCRRAPVPAVCCAKRSTSSPGNTSPPTTTTRSAGKPTSPPTASSPPSIVGPSRTTLICRLASSSRTSSRSRLAPGGASTLRPPPHSASSSSHQLTSKPGEACCKTWSCALIRALASRHVSCWHRLAWLIITALGSPVDPEVNSTYASRSPPPGSPSPASLSSSSSGPSTA